MTRVKNLAESSAGFTLIEILVALPLVALVGTVCVQLLLAVHRRVLHDDGWLAATRELRHSSAMLSTELKSLRPLDIVAWSDTAIEFDGVVATAIVCAANRSRGTVTLAGSAGDLNSAQRHILDVVRNTPAQTGDRVALFTAGATPSDAPREIGAILRSVSSSHDCDASPLQIAGASATQLILTDSLIAAVAVGTPARITRRTRYSLYRASDNDFYLGRRTFGVAGWDVIQPVAGPLMPARDRGLVVTVRDSSGSRISPSVVPSSNAARVSLEMRAPRKSGRANSSVQHIDSTLVDVALRAHRGGV